MTGDARVHNFYVQRVSAAVVGVESSLLTGTDFHIHCVVCDANVKMQFSGQRNPLKSFISQHLPKPVN